jgi:RimJ/RimL family protein N-acetyltransferase
MTSPPGDANPRPSAFEGRLVRLRPLEESDADALNPLFGDPAVLATLDFAFPQSTTGFLEFVRSSRGSSSQVAFAIETLEGEAIGVCDLREIEPRARTGQVGIWIARHAWGGGYGTDAMRVLCRFGFRELNLHRIGLHVYETNPAGIRAYEKVGFRREGTMRRAQFAGGRYLDVHVMGLLAEELVTD